MSFTHALKWSFLAELASKAIQPLVFIVLARLLTPEDFGIMTAATMVIAFSQILWEAGMSKALIQRQTDIDDAANAAFLINIALGVSISGVLYIFAHPIAMLFFQDERVVAVLEVMTLYVVIGSFGSVQTALLQKNMDFKTLFWVRFATVSMPGIASIPLAWNGWGYWSLVIGTLLGQLAQVVMLWRLSGWKPRNRMSMGVTKQILTFGAWVSASGLLNWFYAWGDTLVIGRYLGIHDLGLYRIGHQLSDLIYVVIFSPIVPVIYSHLSKMSNNQFRMGILIQNILKAMMWISFPMGAFLFVFGEGLEVAVFGGEWKGLGLVIGYLSLRQSFASISFVNGEVYRSIGKPQYETIILLASLLLYVPVYFYLVKINLLAFVYGRLALVIISTGGHLWFISVLLKLRIVSLIYYGFLILGLSFLLALFTFFSVKYLNLNELIGVVVSFVAYLFVIIVTFTLLGQSKLLRQLKSDLQLK